MNRREFVQNFTASAAFAHWATRMGMASTNSQTQSSAAAKSDVEGHTFLAEFSLDGIHWKVYEDLRSRDGDITFVSPNGARVMRKTAEAAFADADPAHLGLSMDEIGLSGPDLLADKLLDDGDDPDPEMVKKAAPPQGSAPPSGPPGAPAPPRARWDAFVGTKQAYDTQPVYPSGNTRTYHPNQYIPEIRGEAITKRFDGLLGGWMPAVRKVLPISADSYAEVIVFGDVEAQDRFIVQTWHRTAEIKDGKIARVYYGYSYPAFPPARHDPKPEEFYRALLVFANYWEHELLDFAATALPDNSWPDMAKHAFAKELMVRPGGVYPKYGAVDRDYYGSEYDGFQDIFTSAAYTSLEWGRFEPAREIIDNYFSQFVDSNGMINMRGPETAQFGLTLSLLARYYDYTRDAALISKHRGKIAATARMLVDMHEQSLKLPSDNPGHGLIHGWSESDACLAPTPAIWWQPYFANSAFAARGLRDLARIWPQTGSDSAKRESESWIETSKTLQETTIASITKNIWQDQKPPYIGPLPGTKLMFRDAMAKERPSPQQWPHRPYSELLQADVLPAKLANTVIDCMRAYGATTLGVVANVTPARPGARAILGFISYGYAQALLRLDRIEEFLLFLYSHRYHDHTRGSWVAGEVSGINGGTALFCIPAQQTIPLLMRWMLVLDDSDDERLYFGKGLPRAWVVSGKPVQIDKAPTRWGRVGFNLIANPPQKSVIAKVQLASAGKPRQIEVKLRVPKDTPLRTVTVNGRPATLGGVHQDTVTIATDREQQFEIVGRWA
ncbi:MAG TPA: Tat pathway signal protein [Terriglobales bacterium]